MGMTYADIQKTFQTDLTDEIEDCNKYLDMAMAAKGMGQMEMAEGLHMIAKDEYTHAKWLHKMLKHSGVEVTDGQNMAFEKMEERVHGMFH